MTETDVEEGEIKGEELPDDKVSTEPQDTQTGISEQQLQLEQQQLEQQLLYYYYYYEQLWGAEYWGYEHEVEHQEMLEKKKVDQKEPTKDPRLSNYKVVPPPPPPSEVLTSLKEYPTNDYDELQFRRQMAAVESKYFQRKVDVEEAKLQRPIDLHELKRRRDVVQRRVKRKRGIYYDEKDQALRAKARIEEERLSLLEHYVFQGIDELDVEATVLLQKFEHYCELIDRIIRDLGELCEERFVGSSLSKKVPILWDALCKLHALLLTGHRREMDTLKLRVLFRNAASKRSGFLTDKQRAELVKWADEATGIIERENSAKQRKDESNVDSAPVSNSNTSKQTDTDADKEGDVDMKDDFSEPNFNIVMSPSSESDRKQPLQLNYHQNNNNCQVIFQPEQIQMTNPAKLPKLMLDVNSNTQEIPGQLPPDFRNGFIPLQLTKREATLKKLVDNEWKMYLVLDIDFTLLNSAMFSEVPSKYNELLFQQLNRKDTDLFLSEELSMWTKLRPAVHQFLELVSTGFELWLFTNATKKYADKMVLYLDPENKYFGERVICQGASGNDPRSTLKCLAKGGGGVLEGKQALTLVVDDSQSVWPDHQGNLIRVEKYVYFPSTLQEQVRTPYLEQGRDECDTEGILMRCASILERVREEVVARLQEIPDEDEQDQRRRSNGGIFDWDVRSVLKEEKQRVLQGVYITFSRIIPLDRDPTQHRHWKMAEEFGAKCLQNTDPKVTHVVASSWGTDKVRWATTQGRHVVTINWLECCCTIWKRADESCFALT